MGEVAHTLRLAQELRERGNDVLLCARPESMLRQRAEADGFRVEPMNLRAGIHPILMARDIRHIKRVLNEFDPDVVHVHRAAEHWLMIHTALFTKLRPPLVRTRHAANPYGRSKYNRSLLMEWTDRTIAVSGPVVSTMDLPDEWGVGERLQVIHSGVDTREFSPDKRSDELRREMNVGDGECLVGLVGRFQRVKGHTVFFDAITQLKDRFPGARFALCGNTGWSKLAAFRERMKDLGIDDRVSVYTDVDDIGVLVASMDIGIVASIGSEGSSRAAMEYQACGLPVVATRVGSLPEMIDPDVTGLLIDPRSPQQLADAIASLLTDTSKRVAMGAAALEWAHGRFSIERWIDETWRVYDEAMDQAQNRGPTWAHKPRPKR